MNIFRHCRNKLPNMNVAGNKSKKYYPFQNISKYHPFQNTNFALKEQAHGYTGKKVCTYFVKCFLHKLRSVNHNFPPNLKHPISNIILQATESLKLSYKFQCYGICHIGWVLAKVYVK